MAFRKRRTVIARSRQHPIKKPSKQSVKFDHVKLTSRRAAVSAGDGASGGGSAGGGVSGGRQPGAGQY